MRHIFIIGAKGFTYGGYETFLDKLTEYHQNNREIQYYIMCKANGIGITDEKKLKNVKHLSNTEYIYHNAHCFKIKSLDLGSAQAIIYDIKALQYCCNYIKKNNIENPIIYVLSSRVGPAMKYFMEKIRKFGGKLWHNPDGWEFKREKYNWIIRKYWKLSESLMVKNADLEVCDSKTIENYICKEYARYNPKTIFIAYGSDARPSKLLDTDLNYITWKKKFNLVKYKYYVSVGRFVPENNFETMIREFMKSETDKDFVIITTKDHKFLNKLDCKLHFSQDKRIKFAGTVYNQELLKKIREDAYGYFHGHSVGGTNPSLLEALSSTKLNFLYDVGFNREVANDAALYWNLEEGNLAEVINKAEHLNKTEIAEYEEKAKNRILNMYNWKLISDKYKEIIMS